MNHIARVKLFVFSIHKHFVADENNPLGMDFTQSPEQLVTYMSVTTHTVYPAGLQKLVPGNGDRT